MKEAKGMEEELEKMRKEREVEMERINSLADAANTGGIVSLVQTSL
jgi:flagellar motor component MotA